MHISGKPVALTLFTVAACGLSACSGGTGGTVSVDDTELTAPDSQLAFGEPATVATEALDGSRMVWEVTGNAPDELTPQDVNDNVGAQVFPGAGDAEKILCFNVTVTLIEAPGVSTEVAHPAFHPIGADGEPANQIVASQGDAAEMCGVPEEQRLPEFERGVVGETYTMTTIGYISPTSEQSPTGVAFEYFLDSVEEIPSGATVSWSE